MEIVVQVLYWLAAWMVAAGLFSCLIGRFISFGDCGTEGDAE
jgi:hypothetical protein